jgi:dTDP-glucose 4,6-dehydratase
MRLVVTGGAGFIGSAVVCRAVRDGHTVLTVDKLTYAGRMRALDEVSASPLHCFLKADIADNRAIETAFADFQPDAVLHIAAECHVDRSIDDPNTFITTNVQGTFVLLEAALRYWSRRRSEFRFVHI